MCGFAFAWVNDGSGAAAEVFEGMCVCLRECVSDLIRRIIMKPRLNPPDVSAVVPPPQPPLLWQRNYTFCQLDSNQSSYYGLQRMVSERVGWGITGFH